MNSAQWEGLSDEEFTAIFGFSPDSMTAEEIASAIKETDWYKARMAAMEEQRERRTR